MGLGAVGGKAGAAPAQAVAKDYDPDQPRDEDGRWTATGNTGGPMRHPARKPRPTGFQAAGLTPAPSDSPIGQDRTSQGSAGRPPASDVAPPTGQYALAGTLIDKRYDEVIGYTHCTYATPLGTYTMEVKGHFTCPLTTPAPRDW